MLRLWPDTVVIGLFPQGCWLRSGKRSLRRDVPLAAGIEQVLCELDELLNELGAKARRFTRAEVYLSDGYCRSILVPWQFALESDEQIQQYGRACLEGSGSIVDGDWAVHCGFRHHGAPGLAACVPAALIGQIQQRLSPRGIRLRSVMPISSAAYWYHRPARSQGTYLLLLEEAKRLTAFAYSRGRAMSIDIEPMFADKGRARERLFNRLNLAHQTISNVHHWAIESHGANDDFPLPGGAVITRVLGERWSVA